MVISLYFLSSFIPVSGLRKSRIILTGFGKRLYQTYKENQIKFCFLEIIFVELQQRNHICWTTDQLYNSCKKSRDYICKGSFANYSVQKRMILVKRRCFVVNQLIINEIKTKFMVFHRRNKLVTTVLPSIHINNSSINRFYSFTFLGVILDVHFKFKDHVLKVTKNISKFVPLNYLVRKYINRALVLQLYFGLIYLKLDLLHNKSHKIS